MSRTRWITTARTRPLALHCWLFASRLIRECDAHAETRSVSLVLVRAGSDQRFMGELLARRGDLRDVPRAAMMRTGRQESSAALRVRRALALGAWEPPDPGALDLHTPWEEAGSALPFDRSLRAADADGRATRRGTRVGTSASLGVALARVLCACGVPGTDREPTLAAPVAAGIRRMMADAEARGEVSDSMVLGLRPSSAR